MLISNLFVFLSVVLPFTVGVTVPQQKVCDYDECPSVSRVGLGALHLSDKISGLTDATAVNTWIQQAVSLGINLFDLADVYPVKGGNGGDSAKLFGEALALTPGLREKLFINAKMGIIFPTSIDTTRAHLSSTLDWYLEVLGTTYVDMLMIHYSDSFMDANEVAQFFVDVKAAGKVNYFGVSNHYPSKYELLATKLDAVSGGSIKLMTHEFEASAWNPSYMSYNSALADHAYKNSLHPFAWSSLGGDPIGGLNRLFVRTGARQKKILHALGSVGAEMGIEDKSVVALTWLMSHPLGFIPLLGTTDLERLQLQVTAFDYLGNMTSAQWWKIGQAGGLCPMGDSECNYSEYMAIN